jgi:hypothetical protein
VTSGAGSGVLVRNECDAQAEDDVAVSVVPTPDVRAFGEAKGGG